MCVLCVVQRRRGCLVDVRVSRRARCNAGEVRHMFDTTSASHQGQRQPNALDGQSGRREGLKPGSGTPENQSSAPSILIQGTKAGRVIPAPTPEQLQNAVDIEIRTRIKKLEKHCKYTRGFAAELRRLSQSHPSRVEAIEMVKRADNLESCGEMLWFRDYYEHPARPVKLAKAITCRQTRLCGFCAARASAVKSMELIKRVERRMDDRPGLVPYFVTGTLRSQASLRPMLELVSGAMSKLVQRRRDNRKRQHRGSIASFWDGGFMSLEVKRGRGGLWHPHFHALVLTEHDASDRWTVLAKRFEREWACLVGQCKANVYYRPVEIRHDNSVLGAVHEACKYAVKFEADKPLETWDAFKALGQDQQTGRKGIQTLRTFGSLRGRLPDDLTDDLDGLEAYAFNELRYRFHHGAYHQLPEPQRVAHFDDFNKYGYQG